jgi:hypothetical protein
LAALDTADGGLAGDDPLESGTINIGGGRAHLAMRFRWWQRIDFRGQMGPRNALDAVSLVETEPVIQPRDGGVA